MPTVTAISLQQKNKDRCNLFVDGEFFAGVSLETVVKFRLKVGLEIDFNHLKEMICENERSEALNKAVNYISKNLKTKRQVRDYLLKKGYSEDTVWYCIDKLKEYNYIDDKEYSQKYIESTSKTQGQRLIEYKLMMKGVKKQDILAAYEDCDIDANQNAKTVADKYLRNKERTKENLAKAYRYLLGKGFSYEQARFAIGSFDEEN